MTGWWWWAFLAVPLLAADVGAQRIVIVDRGPGASGRIIADATSAPHTIIAPDSAPYILRRGETQSQTLIVLGRDAAIEGAVDGDVIVVDGDLFVRPRARITGKAVAIGGAVYPIYPPPGAMVLRGSESFRDNTFDITQHPDGYHLAYRSLFADASRALTLPGLYGVRLPAYDRVNGLSVGAGPALRVGRAGEVNALATYRSDLGKIDPSVTVSLSPTPALRIQASAARGTFSNDRWIRPDLLNSAIALVTGKDTRNYYRADRAEATVHRLWERPTLRIEPFAGLRTERAWSSGPAPGERRGPWSIFGKTDTLEGMYRPNPAVMHGALFTALGGSGAEWESRGGVRARARVAAEHLLTSSASNLADPLGPRPLDFTQLTSDLEVRFVTFGVQEYRAEVHWVTTPGSATPPQRFSYFGGSGTMPFLDLLEQGGDELFLLDQRYSVPLMNVRLGFFGSPVVILRHRLGSAGIGDLPALEQVLSLGAELSLLRAEVRVNAATGAVEFSAGLVFTR